MGRSPGDVVLPAHENVSGLDVPVKNVRPMNHGQSLKQRFHDGEQILLGERLPGGLTPLKKLRQRQSVVVVP